ncbi:MAG: hypothetical protein IT293_12175 [Deltaproteobacteria bacterium]|nr:hypothetical protein [Deltaproteobacteria bacterium]
MRPRVAFVLLVLAVLATATVAYASVTTLTVNKCLAGKLKGTGKTTATLAGCASKDAGKPDATALATCRGKASDKFDGGALPAKGVLEKLETKYAPASVTPCLTFDDTATIAGDMDATLSAVGTTVGANPTGSACDAAKLKCVGKYIGGVLGCYGKAAGKGGFISGDCVAKLVTKLSNGSNGCLDKAAARADCTSSGSQASALAMAGDAFVEAATCTLDPGNPGCPPPPPSCPLPPPTLAAGPAPLHRPADPVVLTGADVAPRLVGIAPGELVAFRWEGAWVQIPVQVDERAVINFNDVYNNMSFPWGSGGGFMVLDYTDAQTFTGADVDTTLDSDDEIAFMAADAGTQPPAFSEPTGVIASSGVRVTITDPLNAEAGYVYLFRQDGSLDPSAGQQYVRYDFVLLSGNYKSTYQIADGPNPEASRVCTTEYARGFHDRWLQDELRVFSGGAAGVDILDRNKILFAPSFCGRSEDTFDGLTGDSESSEGAFVANKSGPVRGIRSFIGANSGPRSQQEQIFYRGREEATAFLRVHAISGIMTFRDFSSAAAGMTYANVINPAGATIDGVADAMSSGTLSWELATGAQGSVAIVNVVETDVPGLTPSSYYLDDASPTPSDQQCTGDAYAYGASGPWINQFIPSTDPSTGGTNFLRGRQVLYYDAPGLTTTAAATRQAWVATPLTHATANW